MHVVPEKMTATTAKRGAVRDWRYGGISPEWQASGPDPFFFEHVVDEIEDELPLAGGGVGGAVAMQIAFAADQEFEADLFPFHLDPELEWAAGRVLALGRGEKVRGQDQPVETENRASLEGSFQVGVNIIPFHRGHLVDHNLAHR
jgi:hypothetical protein